MNKQLVAASFFLLSAIGLKCTLGQEKKVNYNIVKAKNTRTKYKDDTKYIQNLINKAKPGDTVKVPMGVYNVHSVRLKSGVSVYSAGLFKQLPPDTTENFSFSKQYSESPMFYGDKANNISLTFNAEVNREAIYLNNCKNVTVRDVKLKGDSTKLLSFAGIYLYACDDINIVNAEISHFGKERNDPVYYQRGTGIRAQTTHNLKILNSNIHHNGENGLFFHCCTDIVIKNNYVHHNGMSGIQVAFGSMGIEKNYEITHNTLEANAADAIDINNPDEKRLVDLQAIIQENISKNNGWVKGQRTRDGSGIATLVGLRNVVVKNNRSKESNRPAVYVRECDAIDVLANDADNVAEIVGNLGHIRLYKNTFPEVRLLASVKAKKLTLDSNYIRHLSFPNGISVDSLVLFANDLKGNINVNMDGRLIFKDNKISSSSPKGAITLWKVSEAVLSGNQIQTSHQDALALYVDNKANNVLIKENKIAASLTCIKDGGSQNLKIIGNTLASDLDSVYASTVISVNPKDLHLNNNIYYLGKEKTDHAIGLEGEGKVYMEGESLNLLAPDRNN
jgi:hypothetical protein